MKDRKGVIERYRQAKIAREERRNKIDKQAKRPDPLTVITLANLLM